MTCKDFKTQILLNISHVYVSFLILIPQIQKKRVLALSSVLCLDSFYYKKLTLTSFNFLKVKILSNQNIIKFIFDYLNLVEFLG